MSRPDYDTTLARIAGNIASGLIPRSFSEQHGSELKVNEFASVAVALARAIVAEVKRTTPTEDNRG